MADTWRGAGAALLTVVFLIAGTVATLAQGALNLRDADLRSFVEIVSQSTGRSFILDPRAQGSVTVYAPSSISDDALYQIFLDVLELNGLTLVEGRQADRIVPLDLARELSVPGGRQGEAGQYETRIIEVQNIPLDEAIEVIRPLLPADAVLSAVPESGVLILSDRKENYDRIARLVERLDGPRSNRIEAIRLRNGSAVDILQTLQALNIAPPGASLSADARGNAVVVAGTDEFRTRIRDVVRQLDTPQQNLRTAVVRLNYADAEALGAVVAQSFGASVGLGGEGEGVIPGAGGTISIVADIQSNALVINAPSNVLNSVVQSIRALNSRPRQVLIEAVIFELSVENFADLTVQFAGLLNDAIVGGVEFSLAGRPTLTNVISSAMARTPTSPGSGGTFGGAASGDGDKLVGFLSALVSQTSTRLLSTPSIMTLDNTEAEIVVAQNVPFVTGSYSTVGDDAIPNQPFQTIEREDVGLTLRVLPQITGEGTVRMAIRQEVSSLTNTASAAGGEITAKRALTTNVLVGDGRVIMLGGLLENGSGSVEQRVPGISRIPLVGGLFQGRNTNRTQRVLLVLLRPRIVSNETDAKRLTSEVARETRRASVALRPDDRGRFPRLAETAFPYDGVDLNQPFDLDPLDDLARQRAYPALPQRLRFK